jgi:histidinol dehydrogenase
VIEFEAGGLAHVAADVVAMAQKEGLTGHARSVTIRRTKKKE